MSLTATFDAVLSRVRLAGTAIGARNPNPYMEVDASDWTAVGGARTRSTAQFHEGVASLLLTPDGVTLTPRVETASVTGVVTGATWRSQAWVRCADARTVTIGINWFSAGNVYLSTSSTGIAVAATTWTSLSFQAAAPATAVNASIFVSITGTPSAAVLLYVDEAMLGLASALTATTALFERSINAGASWATVRGGSAVPIVGRAAAVDDYEFTPGAAHLYRLTAGGDPVTASVTPVQTGVWLKNLVRPFLNREVKVVNHSDIVRPARTATFPVIGRTMPVALTDIQLSRRWDLVIKADTVAEADDLELVFAAGDVLLVQPPSSGNLATVPGGYVVAGDVTRNRFGTSSPRRWFTIPFTEVAAPGPGVYGTPATWATIAAEFGSWTPGLTGSLASWTAVTEYISDPSVVIVP